MNEKNVREPAKDAAKEKARKHVAEKGMPDQDQHGQPVTRSGLVTADQLLAGYQTGFLTTKSGRKYEIQTVQPGDFVRFIKVPVLALMVEQGVNVADSDATMEALKEMDQDQMIMTVEDDRFIDLCRRVACSGVVSVDFRMESQAHLSAASGEVSIQLIPGEEAVELYNAIMEISFPPEVAEKMRSFREELQSEEGRGDQDTSDGESLQPETESDPISEGEES